MPSQKTFAELSGGLSLPINEVLRLTYQIPKAGTHDVLYAFDSVRGFKNLSAFRTASVDLTPNLNLTPRLAIVETTAKSNKFRVFHSGERFTIAPDPDLQPTEIRWSFISLSAQVGPGSVWPGLSRTADLRVQEMSLREVVAPLTSFDRGTTMAVGFQNLANAIGDASLLRYVLMTEPHNLKYQMVAFYDTGSGAEEDVICNLCANGWFTDSICSSYNCLPTV